MSEYHNHSVLSTKTKQKRQLKDMLWRISTGITEHKILDELSRLCTGGVRATNLANAIHHTKEMPKKQKKPNEKSWPHSIFFFLILLSSLFVQIDVQVPLFRTFQIHKAAYCQVSMSTHTLSFWFLFIPVNSEKLALLAAKVRH